MARYGMVIERNKCIGCFACAIACKAEHGTPPGVWRSKVLVSERGKYPNSRVEYTPILCMHCNNAPCVEVCPTKASYKRPDGIVDIDYDKCMGCGYCIVACPYGARTKIDVIKGYYEPEYRLTPYEELMYKKHQKGVAEKCTFCKERVEEGRDPACVQTCGSYARHFGDLDDPESEVSKLIAQKAGYTLLPEQGTEPSVYYIG